MQQQNESSLSPDCQHSESVQGNEGSSISKSPQTFTQIWLCASEYYVGTSVLSNFRFYDAKLEYVDIDIMT